jgi:hypothetical protein
VPVDIFVPEQGDLEEMHPHKLAVKGGLTWGHLEKLR